MSIRNKLLAVMTLGLASLEAAACGSFKVSAQLSHQGKAFAAPSAVVKDGVPASIEVSGPNGYKLSLTVTDVAPDKIRVAATVDSSHGAMAPTLVVRPGQPATVTIGDIGLTLTVQRSGSEQFIQPETASQ